MDKILNQAILKHLISLSTDFRRLPPIEIVAIKSVVICENPWIKYRQNLKYSFALL
jgi:hypothetical protein